MGCGCGNKNKAGKNKAALMDPKHGYLKDIEPVTEQLNQKEGPNLLQKALNFGEALVEHVADGMTTVTKLQLAARLAVCSKCPFNKKGNCMKCGCIITTKAKWRSSECPVEYWPTFKKD